VKPVNVDPVVGVAVSVTVVPSTKSKEHVVPQLIPQELVTVPWPAPAVVTFSGAAATAKVAVTDRAWSTVTVHGPVPVHPAPVKPVKPLNVDPAAGVAVSVTVVPSAKSKEHVVPQLIPAGELVTVPWPAPAFVTLSAAVATAKVAVTDRAWSTVTVHGPVPVHPTPEKPVKVDP
jgi:hypothetical protein